jgi:exopolyphosphatase/guanosine-5'-triphosphate,3'-diphosphate pyrophosphatase
VKIHLVRHGKAERRLGWVAPGPLRPVAPLGLRQSHAIAHALSDQGISRIVSSPHLRCAQTVEPLAKMTGLPIEFDERLAEGESTRKTLALLEEMGDEPVVLCSHGAVIPDLLCELEERGVRLHTDGRFRCQKGSIWVIEGKRGQARSARYAGVPLAELAEKDAAPVDDNDRERLAILDLGSTSFRLVVFDATRAGHLTRVANEREMLRLGAAISLDGTIPGDACREAVAKARRLGEIARAAGATKLLPVGTAALRDAQNGDKLAAMIGQALGSPVRIVSGEQEARLLFLAFRRRALLPPQAALGVDLGGGSLELVAGDTRDIQWETTLPVGVTRLHRELVSRDPMRKRDVRAIRERLLAALEPHRNKVLELAPETCIASGGSARAFARLAVARRGLRPNRSSAHLDLPVDELRKLTRQLVRASHDERLATPGVRKNRADLLPTAGILLTTLAEGLGIDSYTVCDWGLREGVALEALDLV